MGRAWESGGPQISGSGVRTTANPCLIQHFRRKQAPLVVAPLSTEVRRAGCGGHNTGSGAALPLLGRCYCSPLTHAPGRASSPPALRTLRSGTHRLCSALQRRLRC